MNDLTTPASRARRAQPLASLIVSATLLAPGAHLAQGQPSAASSTQPATAESSGFSGKVIETTNAATYTYLQVDTGTKRVWAAAPQFAVKVGDSVVVSTGMPMANYHSKTLNRDFDVVYFTGNVAVNGAQPSPAAQTAKLPKDHPPITGTAAKSKVDLTGIKKAAGGRTIQEIYADKAKLSGKEVKVRGKVVKYNAQIMGKNWLHIQDGTGDAGSNDLTITTSSPAKLGDTVLVVGKIATNKDFGSGYKYALMIEDAQVTIE